MTPTFQGEVQLRRWSNSSTQGIQVTFALAEDADLETLKHKAGKRFMAVLVEIGDDEQPIQPAPKKDQRGPLCREACDYCKLPAFWRWLELVRAVPGPVNEDKAALWIKRLCDVDSRKELDADRQAAEDFITCVRVPFMKWQRSQK